MVVMILMHAVHKCRWVSQRFSLCELYTGVEPAVNDPCLLAHNKLLVALPCLPGSASFPSFDHWAQETRVNLKGWVSIILSTQDWLCVW